MFCYLVGGFLVTISSSDLEGPRDKGLRVLGFRGLGFRCLGFRVAGLRVKGLWILGFAHKAAYRSQVGRCPAKAQAFEKST